MIRNHRTNTIHILTVTDNHYLVMLAALIKSVEDNHLTNERILFHIIADAVSQRNRLKLESSLNSEKTTITWYEMKDVVPTSLRLPKDSSSYPINIYLRLFFPWILDKKIPKILYLDCDMLVLKDIGELFSIDLEDFTIGAVQDTKIKTFDNPWGGIKNYKKLAISGESLYFNSGLLLINCDKWNDLHITQKVIDCIDENKEYLNYPDQYGLNVVLCDQWLNLDARWNTFSTFKSSLNPFVIHFTERKPIYKSYSSSLYYQELFFFYLNRTMWKDFKRVPEHERLIKKLINVIEKFKVSSILQS